MRLSQVTAGGTKFAIMAVPPEDAQIPAAPDALALRDVDPAQAQAQAPVDPAEDNSFFLVSSFGF